MGGIMYEDRHDVDGLKLLVDELDNSSWVEGYVSELVIGLRTLMVYLI